jgi:hypothetical protein
VTEKMWSRKRKLLSKLIANWRCLQIDPQALFYFIPLFENNKS